MNSNRIAFSLILVLILTISVTLAGTIRVEAQNPSPQPTPKPTPKQKDNPSTNSGAEGLSKKGEDGGGGVTISTTQPKQKESDKQKEPDKSSTTTSPVGGVTVITKEALPASKQNPDQQQMEPGGVQLSDFKLGEIKLTDKGKEGESSPKQPGAEASSSSVAELDSTSKPIFKTVPVLSPTWVKYEFETVEFDSKGNKTRHKKEAQTFTEDLGDGIKLEMVEIPAGNFQMGLSKKETLQDFFAKEPSLQSNVQVLGFSIGKYEVTQGQWRAIMGYDVSDFKGDNYPMVKVSWDEAVEFCLRLSNKTGRTYRLPNEAEWEFACRAGTTTSFSFGQKIDLELVNYNGDNRGFNWGQTQSTKSILPKNQIQIVGSLIAPNAFGLFDMHGNVWEWCLDEISNNSSYRIARGGSWLDAAYFCRSGYRYSFPSDHKGNHIGFRVVMVEAKKER
ncbi:MAG: formylglycine-generating enzyme family protein [Blastocatellales bacterium]